MFANEPCVEDQIPKNRQNNVYGHGHVEALAAVMEAAQRDYQFDTSVAVVVETDAWKGRSNPSHAGRWH